MYVDKSMNSFKRSWNSFKVINLLIQTERRTVEFWKTNKQESYPSLQVLVFFECYVNPRARNPSKSIGKLQKSVVKHPPPLPTGWGRWGRVGKVWGEGHVGRGGGCFTMDFCRFPVDLDGSLDFGTHSWVRDTFCQTGRSPLGISSPQNFSASFNPSPRAFFKWKYLGHSNYWGATIVFDHLETASWMTHACRIDSKHSWASKTQ